jgi:hypothetical protein
MSEPQGDNESWSLELAVLVRPDVGLPAGPQEIWEKVVEDNARLPGDWDCSVHGAMEAVRNGDLAVCAYLSARCFKDAGNEQLGAQALAAPDEKARNYLWLTGVEPVVVSVPPGLERLCVLLDGKETPQLISSDRLLLCDGSQDRVQVKGKELKGTLAAGPNKSAEHFNAGETVELSHLESGAHRNRSRPKSVPRPHVSGASNNHSKAGEELRRLCLDKRQLLDLRKLLPQAESLVNQSLPTLSNGCQNQMMLSEDGSATMLPASAMNNIAPEQETLVPWRIPGLRNGP